MKFLMIDDDDYKKSIMKEYFDEHSFETASSYVPGMRKLVTNNYDGLILDMNFPLHDDNKWEDFGPHGIDVLQELRRKNIQIPTVIFSSEKKDVSEYENVWGYIIHNNVYIKDDVLAFIKHCSEAVKTA